MKNRSSHQRVLLISNSTLYGSGYLDHAESEIRSFLRDLRSVLFIPYALYDRDAYASMAQKRFERMGYALESIHTAGDPRRAVNNAESIFVGGGNTSPKRNGLPTIQGVVLLCDGENGYPLALMDSIEITTQRTGAATGVAAKYLARTDSKTVTVCGCGYQGRISMRALSKVLPIEKVYAFDIDRGQAERLTKDLTVELGIKMTRRSGGKK